MNNRIKQEDAYTFMIGGNAKLVLHTLKSDKQFKYFIQKKTSPVMTSWWIYLEDRGRNLYLGFFKDQDSLVLRPIADTENSEHINEGRQLFEYFWNKLKSLEVPDRLLIYHTGYCSVCGRTLKDAKSLSIGIGPECLKRMS